MSGLGLGDMGEVEQTSVLFVQRWAAGPPGGSGSPDKNITYVRASVCVRCWDTSGGCVCTNLKQCVYRGIH